jgi:hypothetical protein
VGKDEMRNKSRTHDKVLSDAFSSFKKATRKAFAFLRAPAYKFNEVQTSCHPPECIVRYENQTTGVTISYEWGGTPSVVPSRRDPPASGLIALSHDSGLKWHRFRTGPSVAINFVTLGGDQSVVAGGDFGFLLLSRDQGDTWRQLHGLDSDVNLVGAYLLSESKLIVCSSISITYVDM